VEGCENKQKSTDEKVRNTGAEICEKPVDFEKKAILSFPFDDI
jgi:hypothetical protein